MQTPRVFKYFESFQLPPNLETILHKLHALHVWPQTAATLWKFRHIIPLLTGLYRESLWSLRLAVQCFHFMKYDACLNMWLRIDEAVLLKSFIYLLTRHRTIRGQSHWRTHLEFSYFQKVTIANEIRSRGTMK